MIGVAGSPTDLETAEEFFQLFKTPWEVARPDHRYRIVLCSNTCVQHINAELLLVYGLGETCIDREAGTKVTLVEGPKRIDWQGETLPVQTGIATFDADTRVSALLVDGRKAVDYRWRKGAFAAWRIGYDLFGEIRNLLTVGQPVSESLTPTLELHIALLRHLLTESGVPFVEIPPRPSGYDFTCCLTHDVDFFGIRRHKFDRTLAGFAVRASVGTLVDAVRGRRTMSDVTRNWGALLRLPLVLMGLAPDFWRPFEDYARVEDRRRATFFLVPFKGRPGKAPDGKVDPRRAVPYQLSEIREDVRRASDSGSEMAVHGIDAWRDAGAGRDEIKELTSLTGQETVGIRMHWLYFAERSAESLEKAGFAYDSTWGYNDAVGYRAGTSQVFRLPGTRNLMELPLSIMDSALFYRRRMRLNQDDARSVCRSLLANARRFGGTLVINWHCRSLAPDRLWGGFYLNLLTEIEQDDRAWFVTAAEAVRWFRWRRSIRFAVEQGALHSTVVLSAAHANTTAAVIRTYRPTGTGDIAIEDRPFDGRQEIRLSTEGHVG